METANQPLVPRESPKLAMGLLAFGSVLIVAALTLAPGPIADTRAPLHPGRVLADIRYLASDACEGRSVGTPGMERAMAYLETAFREAGLSPVGPRGFRLPFEVTVGQGLGPATSMEIRTPDAKTLAMGTDWTPLPISTGGEFEGPVLFAGHGITAPDLKYDDYQDIDAKGAWVLVLDHEPRENDPASPFRAPTAYFHRETRTKATNARRHGAGGLLLVTDALAHPDGTRELPVFETNEPASPAGLLVIRITRATADRLLKPTGSTLAQLEASISKDVKIKTASRPAGTRVKAQVEIKVRKETAYNIVGLLPGADLKLSAETVMIGAHYDHLGHGGVASLAAGSRDVHHGADDNASGAAGVVALARELSMRPRTARGLAFALFSGEEMGLLGSSKLAKEPPAGLGKVVAMLNMDMVGRCRKNALSVQGVDTAAEWPDLVTRHAKSQKLNAAQSGGGYGPSDHTSYLGVGVPVLFFFTGAHADYHRPSDTWEKINAFDEARILAMVGGVAQEVADRPTALALVKPKEPPPSPGPIGGGRGYGAYFGSVPDFSDNQKGGVKLTAVNPGSPAEQAGVRGGDTIVRFGGVKIDNLHDLTYALRIHRAGDTVEVEVVRGTQHVTGKATLRDKKR